MGKDIKINYVDTNDNRSYHISSKKIKQELGFSAKFNIEDSVKDLKKAFDEKLQNCLDNVEYFNIKDAKNKFKMTIKKLEKKAKKLRDRHF